MSLNDAEISYGAGLFDGEGCVDVHDATGGVMRVTLGNTDKRLCDWMAQHFGGSVCCIRKQADNRKAMYAWTLYSEKAARFLETVRPFLITKAERADLAIEYQSLRKPWKGGRGHKVPESVRQPQRELAFKIRTLNRRGAVCS